MMAADFIWIHLHFPRFARSTRQTPDHSRQLEPRVLLKEAVKMADASKNLLEIQRQYLQMNQLKGFTWKVGLLWLYLWCLFYFFIETVLIFLFRESSIQILVWKHKEKYSTWSVTFAFTSISLEKVQKKTDFDGSKWDQL